MSQMLRRQASTDGNSQDNGPRTGRVRPARFRARGLLSAGLAGFVATLAFAPPAIASVGGPVSTHVGTVSSWFTSDANTLTYSGDPSNTSTAETGTLSPGSAMTIINMTSLVLTQEDTLNIQLAAADHLVLIRVTGVAQIDGTLNGTLGVSSTPGGTVWISATGGVSFGSSAEVNVGSLLTTTSAITDADFFNPGANYQFTGAIDRSSIDITGGAAITAANGLLGFVAPQVTQAAGAVVTGSMASEVVYGSATDYALTFANADPSSDLLGFTPQSNSGAGGIGLHGDTTGGEVFVASRAVAPITGPPSPVILDGNLVANGAAALGNGHVAISVGGRLGRASATAPMQALPQVGNAAQELQLLDHVAAAAPLRARASGNIVLSAPVTSGNDAVLAAAGDLQIASTGRITADVVGLSTDRFFNNAAGANAFVVPTRVVPTRWVVYAPGVINIIGGLDSGQTALWGSSVDSRPPTSTSGNRYVFPNSPELTFSTLDLTKVFPEDTSGSLPYSVTGYQPAVTGLYLADTPATAHSGAAALSSAGAGATARVVQGGYPIQISQGTTLMSAAGYSFAFISSGVLTVVDTTPPVIAPRVFGTLGDNGWYTSHVFVDWSVADAASDISSETGCKSFTISADQTDRTYTCTAISAGGTDSASTTVRRDATAPSLSALQGWAAYASGTWTNQSVDVSFSCSDTGGSGVDALSVRAAGTATATTSYAETCKDGAGNTSPSAALQVNIDKVAPALTNVVAETSGGNSYWPGTWTNQDVTVTWTCSDAGGSGAVAASGSRTVTTSESVVPACADGAGNQTTGNAMQVNVDKVAPVLNNVPADIRVYSMSPAVATWTNPTASDANLSPSGVTCNPHSGDLFPSGSTTVTCTANDLAGNVGSDSFKVTVSSLAVTFDRPIDGPGTMNISKLGRVIPVKVSLTADGVPVVAPAPLPIYIGASTRSCTGAVGGDEVETYAAGSSNTGNVFRWDASSGRWAYNLDTTALNMTPSSCYRVTVYYGGTVVGGIASGGSVAGYFYLQTRR